MYIETGVAYRHVKATTRHRPYVAEARTMGELQRANYRYRNAIEALQNSCDNSTYADEIEDVRNARIMIESARTAYATIDRYIGRELIRMERGAEVERRRPRREIRAMEEARQRFVQRQRAHDEARNHANEALRGVGREVALLVRQGGILGVMTEDRAQQFLDDIKIITAFLEHLREEGRDQMIEAFFEANRGNERIIVLAANTIYRQCQEVLRDDGEVIKEDDMVEEVAAEQPVGDRRLLPQEWETN
jgi:hypothetical protein